MGLQVTVVVFLLSFSVSALARTYVKIENLTHRKLELDIGRFGHELSSKRWKKLKTSIRPGQRTHYLVFNRDRGIKRNKLFYFHTKVTFKGADTTEQKVRLWQVLRGKWIHSRMWQGLSLGSPKDLKWHRDRKWRYQTVILDNSLIKISYRAYPDGTDDNIVYRFEEVRRPKVEEDSEKKLKVMAYNVYMRPTSLFKNGQVQRALLIPQHVIGYDVLALSEVFDDDIRDTLNKGLKTYYPYRTKVLGKDRVFEQDGGVQISSRHPILDEDEVRFKDVCARLFEDCLADKGVKYAHILKGNKHIHVFATHLQNGGDRKDIKARQKQIEIMKEFVNSKDIPRDQTVIYAGDFNVTYAPLNGDAYLYDGQEKSREGQYLHLVSTLNVNPLEMDREYTSIGPIDDPLAGFKEGSGKLIDYVFMSKEHKQPAQSKMYALPLHSKYGWRKKIMGPLYYGLSDHYPVVGEYEFE